MPQASPIHIGDRYGKLTVMAFEGLSHDGQRKWLCQCECGSPVMRKTSTILEAVRAARRPMCKRCLQIMRREMGIVKNQAFFQMWEFDRTLYSNRATDVMCEDVQGELEEEHGLPICTYGGEQIDMYDEAVMVMDHHERALTLKQIGKILKITSERVRQLETIALRKILKSPRLCRLLGRGDVRESKWTPGHEEALERAREAERQKEDALPV